MSSRPGLCLALVVGVLVFPCRSFAHDQVLYSCGDVADPPGLSAGDALGVLRAAVSLIDCSLCECDAGGGGSLVASDALITLKRAIGQPVELRCPFCCAHCGCTPQTLNVTISDLAACEDCIPRTPASNTDVDSISIELAGDLNDTYQLKAVAECVWEVVVPDVVLKKTYYGSTVTDCSGSSTFVEGLGALLQVTRTDSGWETRFGTYTESLGWGDFVTASVDADTCEATGSAPNQNSLCHLAGTVDDYDTHAIGGTADIEIADPQPACHLETE